MFAQNCTYNVAHNIGTSWLADELKNLDITF